MKPIISENVIHEAGRSAGEKLAETIVRPEEQKIDREWSSDHREYAEQVMMTVLHNEEFLNAFSAGIVEGLLDLWQSSDEAND